MPPISTLPIAATRPDPGRPRIAALPDGSAVLLRLQTPDDRLQLEGLYGRLSADSRRLRFFTGMPDALPAAMLRRLSAVDGDRHVAVLAIHRGRAVGVARYVRDRRCPQEADVAFVVADEFQRRGVGRVLLRALLEHAGRAGLERLTFDTLGENAAAQALLRSLGADLRAGGGLVSGALPVRAPDPGVRLAA